MITNLEPVVMEATTNEITSEWIFEGHNVEVFELDGEVYFNPYDVGACLGIGDSAVRENIRKMTSKQVVKLTNSDVSLNDIRKLNNAGENFLTEAGVYKLVFKSRKPEAERFTDWIAEEVLPSIRKNGMYATEELLDNPDLLIATATRLKEEKEKRILAEMANAKLIEENTALKPKAAFADMVDCSANSISVGTMAKILKNKGLTDMGPNQFFDWLRLHGYLMRRDGDNVPTRRSINLKVIEPKERIVGNPDCPIVKITPKVTGKGQRYFVDKFINMNKEA